MARVDPLRREAVPELEEFFQTFERRMGFVPNSVKTMARRPKVVQALAALGQAVYDAEHGVLPMGLKSMAAQVSSTATGCLYCQAHFSTNANRMDISDEKIEHLWEFETSPLFTDEERSALRFAIAASQVPNGVTEEHFDELKLYYNDEQIVELLATISYVGYLNRWNDSMGTPIEDFPRTYAQEHLQGQDWVPGKHAR